MFSLYNFQGLSGHVSREEYLLGRKIDTAFYQLEESEREELSKCSEVSSKAAFVIDHEIIPKSMIHGEKSNVQVDMKRKMSEDPLLFICKQEEETKRKITSNPVKMKQLKIIISSMKTKKKRKKSYSSDDSDSSQSESNDHHKNKKKEKKKHKNVSIHVLMLQIVFFIKYKKLDLDY